MKELFFDKVNPLCSFGYTIKIHKPRGKGAFLWEVYQDGSLVFSGVYEEFSVFSSETVNRLLDEMASATCSL